MCAPPTAELPTGEEMEGRGGGGAVGRSPFKKRVSAWNTVLVRSLETLKPAPQYPFPLSHRNRALTESESHRRPLRPEESAPYPHPHPHPHHRVWERGCYLASKA